MARGCRQGLFATGTISVCVVLSCRDSLIHRISPSHNTCRSLKYTSCLSRQPQTSGAVWIRWLRCSRYAVQKDVVDTFSNTHSSVLNFSSLASNSSRRHFTSGASSPMPRRRRPSGMRSFSGTRWPTWALRRTFASAEQATATASRTRSSWTATRCGSADLTAHSLLVSAWLYLTLPAFSHVQMLSKATWPHWHRDPKGADTRVDGLPRPVFHLSLLTPITYPNACSPIRWGPQDHRCP